MKKIFDRYDKAHLAELPRVCFPGRIRVIVGENDAERAVDYLSKQTLLGFDTETKPSFRPGRQHKVALLQVCCDPAAADTSHRDGESVCFLFRLNRLGLPPCLLRLLEDKRMTKVALSWRDDIHLLNQRVKFQAGTFIDLQDIAAEMGIQDMSLQKLYANIFGMKISKGQQLSNWEAADLSEAQMNYAATDAWACVRLYKEMMRMKEEGYTLERRPLSDNQEGEANHKTVNA